MLPIIDLDPSNYSCIYSVLLHIIEQSKVLKVVTPCVTFDQPLWSTLYATLYATQKMLNLFAVTGHIHYVKSARLYLQIMQNLPISHPWLSEQFAVNKLFSVRRSDQFWAGLWTDLTIEQILMRSIKNR